VAAGVAHGGATGLTLPLGVSGYHCSLDGARARILKGQTGRVLVPVSFTVASRAVEQEARALSARARRLREQAKRNPGSERGLLDLGDAQRSLAAVRRDLVRCRDGRLDDLSAPGVPAVKTPWEVGRAVGFQGPNVDPAEAFAYDDQAYAVRSARLHGTTVVVAVHRDAIASVRASHTVDEFADAVIRQFHAAWHVFGGYPLDRFVFLIRAPSDPIGFTLSQGGVTLPAKEYDHLDQAHEIIHAWNGKTFFYEPNGSGDLFQLETWIIEGATIYTAARIDGMVVGGSYYQDQMRGLWEQYRERRGGPFDRAYAELASRASPTGKEGSEYGTMLAARGNALAYLLDRWLSRKGSSIDVLLRRLYLDFGLAGRRFTASDVSAAIRSISGDDTEARFAPYLFTSASLTRELGTSVPFVAR
jgi:hypothetical protein